MREFEQALRALGFSNRQAKAIAREGFRPAVSEPETDRAAILEIRDALKRNLDSMKD